MNRPSRGGPVQGRTGAAPNEPDDISTILTRCAAGDGDAFNRLLPLVYEDLRRIAHRRLQAERTDHTLDTTALVHEAYLELAEQGAASWKDRVHFYAAAARVIRNVLVDYARRRNAVKRGGQAIRVPLRPDVASDGEEPATIDFAALDIALTELGRRDPRLERLVECRYFAGMTVRETAAALGSSERTVARDWNRAKAHLFQALS